MKYEKLFILLFVVLIIEWGSVICLVAINQLSHYEYHNWCYLSEKEEDNINKSGGYTIGENTDFTVTNFTMSWYENDDCKIDCSPLLTYDEFINSGFDYYIGFRVNCSLSLNVTINYWGEKPYNYR